MEVLIDGQEDVDIVLVSVFCPRRGSSTHEFHWTEVHPQSLLNDTGARILMLCFHDLFNEQNIHTRTGLKEAAKKLLYELTVYRKGDRKRPLVFICQDLGGIIVKNLFILAAQNRERYRNILEQTCSIMFFGCPHRVSDTTNFIDQIAVWLCDQSYTTSGGLFSASKSLASSILDINGLFLDTGIMTQCQIVNAASEYPNASKQIFSPFTVTLDIPMEWKVFEPHSFLSLMSREETKLSVPLKEALSSNLQSERCHKLLGAPLLYPCPDELIDASMDWVKEDPAVNNWLEMPDGRFMHLVIDSPHPAGFLSKLKGHDKSDHPRQIFYFCFRKHDARLNNAAALLTTLIAQASSRLSLSATRPRVETLKRASSQKHLSKKDLLHILRDLWARYKQQGMSVVVVIWNLNGCVEPLSWLVDAIIKIESFSESLPQILFQSSGTGNVAEVLGKLRATTIEGSAIPRQSGYQLRCQHEVENLIRAQPMLGAFEETLWNILARHRHHNALDIAITQWVCKHVRSLAAGPEATDVTAKMASLSNISTRSLVIKMMDTIPTHKIQWARKILAWMMVSFRPLTIWELKDAMYPEPISDHPNTSCVFENELTTYLSGLITVENNELCYIHPAVHQHLTHQECAAQVWHTPTAEAHLEVIQDLLAYLRRTKKSSSYSTSLRQDLGSYAVSFLLWHCLEIRRRKLTSALSLYDEVRSHLANFSGGQISELQAVQDKQESACLKTIVTFIVRCGSPVLTTKDLDELCPGWSGDVEVVHAAISEAVLCNDTALLKAIPIPPLQLLDTSTLLSCVSCCDDPELLSYLFTKTEKLKSLPATFLKRAAFLGVEEIINSITEKRMSCDNPVNNLMDDLLLEAIVSGQPEVVGILTRAMKKADQRLSLKTLNLACQEGEPQCMGRILDHEVDTASLEEVHVDQGQLEIACTYGNWKAARKLATTQMFSNIEDKWVSLRAAVKHGFVNCIKQVLPLVDPEACFESDRRQLWEVLVHGISQGQVESCRALLTAGVDPNYAETWENEPVLSLAIRSRKMKLLALLREYEVPLEGKSNGVNTPLLVAASLGLVDIVSFLIEEGADINARVSFGSTALYQACLNNHLDVVKFLLDHGADAKISTHYANWSPLEAAYDYPKILRLLVEKDVDYNRVAGGSTALWRAARDGCVNSVEVLLSKQACEVDFYPKELMMDENGLTALAVAAKRGRAEVARLLLEAEANVNHASPITGDFVLKLAENEEVLAVLLEYSPDVGMTNNVGDTALHSVVFHDELRLVKRLINFKADVNSLNKRNATPLHYACQASKLDVVKLLIKHGADINVPDFQHWTPLVYTCMSGEDQLKKMKYLIEVVGAELDTLGGEHGAVLLGMAALRSDMETVEYLVEHGGERFLNEVDQAGRPPLFHACYRIADALGMVEYLHEQGATISNYRDAMGRTALHCAAATHNVKLVKTLINIEKKLLDETDEDGWTPLHWAMRHADRAWLNSQGWGEPLVVEVDVVKTVETLLDGDPERRNTVATASDRKWTPLKLARYHGVYQMVKHLLSPSTEDDSQSTQSPQLYKSRVAQGHYWVCDACFCKVQGFLYKCLHEACVGNFALCFKCVTYKERIHHTSHDFERIGPEFESNQDDEESDGSEANIDERGTSVEPIEVETPIWDYITMEDP